jgi:hypothetical protein
MPGHHLRYGFFLLVVTSFVVIVGCDDKAESSKQPLPSKPIIPPVSSEPWVSQPPTTWPQFVLTNYAKFKNHSALQGASSFLIRTKDGKILAATAKHLIGSAGGVKPPLSIEDFNSSILMWKMFPRTMSKDNLDIEALGIDGLDNPRFDWLILKIKGSTDNLPAQPLKIRQTPIAVGEKVYLIGCPYSEPKAKQNVYSGKVTARELSDHFRYDIDPPVDITGFSGAPIIDDKGYVVGVMGIWFQPKMQGEKFLEAGGEDIATIYSLIENAQ